MLQALLSDDYDQMKKGLLNIDTAHLEDIAWTPVNQTDPVDKKYEEKLLKLGVDRFMDRILDFYKWGDDQSENKNRFYFNPCSIETKFTRDEKTITLADENEYSPYRESSCIKKVKGE